MKFIKNLSFFQTFQQNRNHTQKRLVYIINKSLPKYQTLGQSLQQYSVVLTVVVPFFAQNKNPSCPDPIRQHMDCATPHPHPRSKTLLPNPTTHTSPTKAMEKFQRVIFKLVETHPNAPLTPARRALLQDHLNQFGSEYKTPDHPPYSAVTICLPPLSFFSMF